MLYCGPMTIERRPHGVVRAPRSVLGSGDASAKAPPPSDETNSSPGLDGGRKANFRRDLRW